MNTRLQTVLKELPGTIDEIAKGLGVSHATLYKYLSGKTKPNADFLAQLKSQTGVNLNWLITGQGEKYGDSNQDDLNQSLLRAVVDSISEYCLNAKSSPSPQEQSALIISIYSMMLKEKRKADFSSTEIRNRIHELISFKYS